MPPEISSPVKFQIGHVLFIDIVGYSKLLINEQSEQIGKLRQIVRGTEAFRVAEAEGKLLRLPTGDGGALVFRNTPEAPIECAMEISKALETHPELRIRMGVHSGPVNEVADLNEQVNLAGAGVNIAQRVMDCGDAGHILLSKRVADDLAPYPKWNRHLHNLGECEVKHGEKIGLVNFFTEQIGNAEVPAKIKGNVRKAQVPLKKSIAVLPFENLSEDTTNAYFADGIQEEILTRLSQIADLKVISRTSSRRFKSSADNLPQIAQQLGVANILEGSVQKAGDQVRVHVQLIDAESDSHLWAERYDRKLVDIFAVESDIAGKIAETLHAKLTGAERNAIAKRPTENSEAHEAFLKGIYYWYKYPAPGFEKSQEYFQHAIDLDPSYAPGYVGLSYYYGFAAAIGMAPPNENWPKAEAAANKAIALDDTLPDAYNATAAVKLYYYRDWPSAERYFRRGIELNPNSAEIRHHYALCLILFGRNEESLAEMRRAAELDPLALRNNLDRAKMFFILHQSDRAIDQFRKTLDLYPDFGAAHEWFGYAYQQKGMLKEAVAEWVKALALSGEGEQASILENTYARSGFEPAVRAMAEHRLKKLDEQVKRGVYVSAAEYATAYTRSGDKEQAFAWLAKAAEERDQFALQFKINPLFDSLRSDPRFEKLVNRVMSPNSIR